jgi:alkylation response protein AidB-like acyl-CoA dehydrogenase
MMVGMSRLARGDASTAIAANMHATGVLVIARVMKRSHAAGDAQMAATLQELLRQIAAGRVLMSFPTSEPGTDIYTPMTEAVPSKGGYVVNGRKIFGTVSPVADLFFPSVRIPNDSGGYATATAIIPRNTPGLAVMGNWDAMGMRASGSNDVVFTNCFVPAERIFGRRENYGKVGRGFPDFLISGLLPLIATFLGIGEAARDFAVATVTKQRKGVSQKRLADRIPIQHLVAECEIDLSVSRAITERVGQAADLFIQRSATTDPTSEESTALMKEVQCMKYVVNRKAIDVVDRAMTVCGGGAFMHKHLLSRLYRDVRAGPFMQPFAPYEAFEYIGKIALGLDPNLDR